IRLKTRSADGLPKNIQQLNDVPAMPELVEHVTHLQSAHLFRGEPVDQPSAVDVLVGQVHTKEQAVSAKLKVEMKTLVKIHLPVRFTEVHRSFLQESARVGRPELVISVKRTAKPKFNKLQRDMTLLIVLSRQAQGIGCLLWLQAHKGWR